MDCDLLRARLRDERARLRRELARLRREVGATGPDETLPPYDGLGQHGSDQASDLLEREIDRSLELDLRAQLTDVELALDRIDLDGFGQCSECDRPIDEERLQAIPWARRCVQHEAAAERADRRVLDPPLPPRALEDSTASDDEDDVPEGSEPAEEAALHVEGERSTG